MRFLPKLDFFSYFVYSPSGTSAASKQSRDFCYEFKKDGHINVNGSGGTTQKKKLIPFSIEYFAKHIHKTDLADLFSDQPTLVPIPSSSIKQKDSLDLPRLICDELIKHGLGRETNELIKRMSSVPKAATAGSGERPSIDTHFNSLQVINSLPIESILLVDDVITSGTVMFSCAKRIIEVMPDTKIRGLALIRTMSGVEVDKTISPCSGTITPRAKWALRAP